MLHRRSSNGGYGRNVSAGSFLEAAGGKGMRRQVTWHAACRGGWGTWTATDVCRETTECTVCQRLLMNEDSQARKSVHNTLDCQEPEKNECPCRTLIYSGFAVPVGRTNRWCNWQSHHSDNDLKRGWSRITEAAVVSVSHRYDWNERVRAKGETASTCMSGVR